jgi:CheY-like chemotaxis protein
LLVVDDEAVVRQLLRVYCRRNGWAFEEAHDGAQALETWMSRSPDALDVVLCDLKMPRVSGIELHDRLHATDPRRLERVVFITGDVLGEETQEFLARTSCQVLMKPFSFDEFCTAIELCAREQAN